MIFVFITMITSFSLSQVYAEPIIYDDDYIVEKFVTGLDYPTTMIFCWGRYTGSRKKYWKSNSNPIQRHHI